MNNTSKLQELLVKVEAGEWDTAMVFSAFEGKHLTTISQAYSGSLDAAKALHEALLPEWRVTHAFGLISGEISKFNLSQNDEPSRYAGASSFNPAHAWLIAILEALIAQEGK
tara:strand:+ start:130 stop:465 length:336 start_codon:yes stop_codon:yes gene_type:complete